MKKILLVAAIASTFMSFADETSNATEVQQIGITAITTSRQSVIVAFSYKGSDGEDLTADKLVKTTNLTENDELHAYVNVEGSSKGKYKSWLLTKDGQTGTLYWHACTESTESTNGEETTDGTPAPDFSQAVGTGIWLKRCVAPNGSYTFYIYGTPATSKEITVPAGKLMLIGNPNSSKTSPTIDNEYPPSQGDVVYIPNDTGFATYTYGKNGKWNKGLTALESLPEFDANTGAWYQSKGSKDVKINWEIKGE